MQAGRDLWRSLVKLQAQSMSIRSGLSGAYPVEFLMSPRLTDLKPLSTSIPVFDCPQGEKDFLISSWKFLSSTLLFPLPLNPTLCASLRTAWICPLYAFPTAIESRRSSLLLLFSRMNIPTQISHAFLTCQVLQLPDHFGHPPPLDSHQDVNFLLVLGSSLLNTILQIQSHKCQIQGKNTLPCHGTWPLLNATSFLQLFPCKNSWESGPFCLAEIS